MTQAELDAANKLSQKIAKLSKEIETLDTMKGIIGTTPDTALNLVMTGHLSSPVPKQIITTVIDTVSTKYQSQLTKAQGDFEAL